MKRVFYTTSILSLLPVAPALAQSYSIDWTTIDGGGVTFSTGGGYELGATIGQPDAGVATGGGYELVGGFWAGAPAWMPVPGDFDGDGDVDLVDLAALVDCSGGPEGGLGSGCETFDFDADGAVDLFDFAEFQLVFAP